MTTKQLEMRLAWETRDREKMKRPLVATPLPAGLVQSLVTPKFGGDPVFVHYGDDKLVLVGPQDLPDPSFLSVMDTATLVESYQPFAAA